MKLTIKKYGINGEGIAYDHKVPVFVKGALIDEEVIGNFTSTFKNYKIAEIKKIIKENPHRVKEVCPFYEKCGACALLHADYDEQLAIKKMILEESLNKYCGLQLDVDIIPSPYQDHYRNSLKLPLKMLNGRLCAGLYTEGSNHFQRIENCINHQESLNKNLYIILKILNQYGVKDYNIKTKKGLRNIVLRVLDGKCSLCLVSGNDTYDQKMIDDILENSDVVSIYQSINTSKSHEIFSNHNVHLGGSKFLTFKDGNYSFDISFRSFLQLNSLAANDMYEYVYELLKDDQKIIVEAYAGLGLMSFKACDKAQEVWGIEIVLDAVNNANKNAKKNKIKNLNYIQGDAAEILYRKFKGKKIDTLIVDPPRSGLDDAMLETMLKSKIDTIIYISCNSATLAKNLDVLSQRYKLENIKAFDLFPNTQHVESVVLLQRR